MIADSDICLFESRKTLFVFRIILLNVSDFYSDMFLMYGSSIKLLNR